MAIKWKNKIKKRKIEVKLIVAGGLLAVGIFFLLFAIYGNLEASTTQIWFFGLIMNLFLGNGTGCFLDYILSKIYGGSEMSL